MSSGGPRRSEGGVALLTRFARRSQDIQPGEFVLLLEALSTPYTCFVIGAGASAPDLPLTWQIPEAFRRFVPEMSAFPAGPLPRTPVRRLFDPVRVLPSDSFSERKLLSLRDPTAYLLEDWKLRSLTDHTVALLLTEVLATPPESVPAQYLIFSYLLRASWVVTYNWDGLARRYCPQRVLEVHGVVPPPLDPVARRELLFWTQLSDGDARAWLPGMVLPGEEEQLRGTPVWEQVGEIWRLAHNVVVIGYSFGLPDSHYDEVWRDAFVDAMRENPAPIHIVSPQAADLAGDLSERIGRETNVFAWPFRWHALSRALIHALRAKGDRRLERLSARRVLWLHEYFCEN